MNNIKMCIINKTRTKTSIRYAKENDREREKERQKERYREGWRDREREVKGIERESVKGRVKFPKPRNKAQTKVDYTKLSLVYSVAQKWVNYRDTCVSKK